MYCNPTNRVHQIYCTTPLSLDPLLGQPEESRAATLIRSRPAGATRGGSEQGSKKGGGRGVNKARPPNWYSLAAPDADAGR
eukprot:4677875-Pyramimonas_sp.AAC.1